MTNSMAGRSRTPCRRAPASGSRRDRAPQHDREAEREPAQQQRRQAQPRPAPDDAERGNRRPQADQRQHRDAAPAERLAEVHRGQPQRGGAGRDQQRDQHHRGRERPGGAAVVGEGRLGGGADVCRRLARRVGSAWRAKAPNRTRRPAARDRARQPAARIGRGARRRGKDAAPDVALISRSTRAAVAARHEPRAQEGSEHAPSRR